MPRLPKTIQNTLDIEYNSSMERDLNTTCAERANRAEFNSALRQSLSVPDRARSDVSHVRPPADLTAGGMPGQNVSPSSGEQENLSASRSDKPDDPKNRARLAAANFISESYTWGLMVTVTNSPYGGEKLSAGTKGAREGRPHFVSEDMAEKRFLNGMNNLNRFLFGQRFYRKDSTRLIWAATLEFQRSGNPHHHALIYSQFWEDILPDLKTKRVGKRLVLPDLEECFTKAGAGPIIRAEPVRSKEQASEYITKACKYITKSDGLIFGGPWKQITENEQAEYPFPTREHSVPT